MEGDVAGHSAVFQRWVDGWGGWGSWVGGLGGWVGWGGWLRWVNVGVVEMRE